MDAAIQKLAIKLKDATLAAALVEAGYDTPAAIRGASDKELLAVAALEPAEVEHVRQRIGPRGKRG
jgi:hypothetical protein